MGSRVPGLTLTDRGRGSRAEAAPRWASVRQQFYGLFIRASVPTPRPGTSNGSSPHPDPAGQATSPLHTHKDSRLSHSSWGGSLLFPSPSPRRKLGTGQASQGGNDSAAEGWGYSNLPNEPPYTRWQSHPRPGLRVGSNLQVEAARPRGGEDPAPLPPPRTGPQNLVPG